MSQQSELETSQTQVGVREGYCFVGEGVRMLAVESMLTSITDITMVAEET